MYDYAAIHDVFRIKTLYTAFALNIGGKYNFAGERHNFWELVIAAEGEIGVTAGENAWAMKAGEAVLHPPMEFHRIWGAGTSGRFIVFSFGADGLPAEAGGTFAGVDLDRADCLLQQTRECFEMKSIRFMGLQQGEMTAHILVKQWELFLLELIDQKKQSNHEEKSRTARNYAAIVRMLEEHIHENLSVEEIAELCKMSAASVKQTFSRYAGMGIMSYFNRMKVEAAVFMLRSGSSVQETAAALGFSSQNYFSTVFKRIMGKPPTAYK